LAWNCFEQRRKEKQLEKKKVMAKRGLIMRKYFDEKKNTALICGPEGWLNMVVGDSTSKKGVSRWKQ